MATYDYMCEQCESLTEVKHGMLEEPSIICEECSGTMHKTFITPPACNLGWDNQAAGNADRYWGNKPIIDINIGNDDGSTTVIPSKDSDYK